VNTTALAITGEWSPGFSKSSANKRMALASKKILLVDDQSDTSLFIALQQEGYEVIACESPQKAWSVVWMLRPHFIVIHLTNPSRSDISTLQGCGVLAGGFLSSLQRPSLEAMSSLKLWRKWPRFFSLFH
jgi:CheY-like chemotaxis protein